MGLFADFCCSLFLPPRNPEQQGEEAESDPHGVAGSGSASSREHGKVQAQRQHQGRSTGWAVGWVLVSGLALLIRLATGLSSYSGQGHPPMFGDYEAQRHWMEITLHTPVHLWYTNSTDNNLLWWGLDYPPLTAYQSYAHGLLLHWCCPHAVALHSSRGFESPESKVLMRWTVVLSDLLIFFPAAVFFVSTFYANHPPGLRTWALALILLHPSLLLIDHGHFQYNCISLGLSLWAVLFIFRGSYCLGSVFFCLAINHKHMSLYFAPAFFGHLLGRCRESKRPLLLFLRLAATVIATFSACWWPYLGSLDSALQVARRLVPLGRGIFEDHVANFWCVSSVLVKWKRLLPLPVLANLALSVTALAAAPPLLHQLLWPSPEGLLLAMLNSSFAFFFFAFQVHEKSILLPLLPASLLVLAHPRLLRFLSPVALFSMFPLLLRDGLSLPYLALHLLFLLLSDPPHKLPTCQRHAPPLASSPAPDHPVSLLQRGLLPGMQAPPGTLKLMAAVLGVAMLGLHLAHLLIPPPPRLPYIHAALFVSLSFFVFLALFAASTCLQWSLVPTPGKLEKSE